MTYPLERLLLLLQRFIKHSNQVNQIHSLLITNGHLHFQPACKNSALKWISTLLYNTLIRAHLNLGDPHKALLLFTHMLAHQAPPNNYTFPSLIKAAASALPSMASLAGRPIHTQVIRRGLSLDPFIQTSLVSFYSLIGDIEHARHVFEEIPHPCIVAFNSMLDAFGKNGNMGRAVALFECMPERDIVSWTSIISGFGKNGHFQEAIRFFEKMMFHEDIIDRLIIPNEATLVSVLSACANLDEGALYQGRQIHGYILRNEIEITVFLGTALIAMYGKTGCLESATRVFNKMTVKEVCTWNAIISSLASNGREKQALDMFEEMRVEGLQPNEVTFVAVLAACARSKLVEMGLKLFRSMLHDFGVNPKMEHYGCVVDLLGRAGLLEEAAEIIRGMPFEPDATVLGALLGACRVHGAVGLASDVGRRLLELQPWHCGRYVVLSNIYAGAGEWGSAADLRKAMVQAGIRKIPAYSCLDSM
ncbi:PREDICTED: putative pentatricopeptide repeat-containing protein At1g10330 [Nelumbo nucifera]|uniref:Pentatricopeptide repeat-containing protein At1g10330 n=2 Tax=Nelumbo nucifera TaxID=4432 RepID=A0A822Y195_NELNU|nr:PREDICTED: putative pentatricopeptide repeat-containing protein At1g10330 [Nelumbo nucifera]DAD23428.1 TPA_asm: hypothetical protein HUJ06_024891 [Nelumbo nucifera]